LLEILDDRHGQSATLITSQFPVSQWHELINDAAVADAVLDRLVHNAYRLKLKGESLRKTIAVPDIPGSSSAALIPIHRSPSR
jgi:DNA replication protein DnaC